MTFIAASACSTVTVGFRRAITVIQRLRRFWRSSQVGVICAFIAIGTITSGFSPATMPKKPGCETPTMVIGRPLSVSVWFSTRALPPNRRIQ